MAELIRRGLWAVSRTRKPVVGEGHEYYHDDWTWFVYGWLQVPANRLIYHFSEPDRKRIWAMLGEGVTPAQLASLELVDMAGERRVSHKWWWKLIRSEKVWLDKCKRTGRDPHDLGDTPKSGHR